MSSTVEQIKEKLGIADVIGSYIKVEPAGGNYKAKCPFHNEKTASFFISPARGTYYCFGCQAKGDIFSFVQDYEKIDFKEALKELAEKAGVKIEREFSKPGQVNERERLFEVLDEATSFFQEKVKTEVAAKEYVLKRGLSEKTLTDWRIGVAPTSWNMLQHHLKQKGFSDSEMEKVGLIKKGDRGYYDRFRSRIMFPLFNSLGKVVGFSGRILEEASAEAQASAKYLNSPDTVLFNKSELLYGFHKAKQGIREKGYAILVEGQMDLLMMHQTGFPQTIATSGTALTKEQLEMLQRISPNLLVVYDGDNAGSNAAVKAWSLGLQTGMDVKIASLPAGQDPADMALADPEGLKTALRNSKHVIDFLLDRLMVSTTDGRKLVQAIEKEVLPYVAMVESSIQQSYFVSRIAERGRIQEDALWTELKKMGSGTFSSSTPNQNQPSAPSPAPDSKNNDSGIDDVLSRRIFGIIFRYQEKSPQKAEELKGDFKKLVGDNYDTILQNAQSNKDALTFEAEMYADDRQLDAEAAELLTKLRIEKTKKEFQKIMSALHAAERDKDHELISELLKKCQELSLQLKLLQTQH